MESIPGRIPGVPGPGNEEAARNQLFLPAILLMIISGLGVALSLVNMVALPAMLGWLLRNPDLPAQYQSAVEQALSDVSPWKAVPLLVLSAVTFVGAFQMMKLRNYGFAIAAAIIACIPCYGSCCCVGLPFGIWSLVLLNRPEVKSAFQRG